MSHPSSQNEHYFFENLDKAIDVYSDYQKNLLVENFNAKILQVCLDSFLYRHELKNLVNEKACFKNILNPSCIDLFLTSNTLSFQQSPQVYQIFIN